MASESRLAGFYYKTLDAVMTATIRARRRRWDNVKRVFSPRSSGRDRVTAVLGLVETVFPGTERRASDSLMRRNVLPFATSSVDLLGSGSGSTVFLLNTARGRIVVKTYRKTIGQRRDVLPERTKEYQRKYETVSSWYAGPHDIVEQASFLVLHGPLLGRPAVACVQTYIDGEKRDLFRDFGNDELIKRMHESRGFREEFAFFARRTLEEYRNRGRCPDLLGDRNLMVVRQGKSTHLKLIDYGILDCEVLKRQTETLEHLADLMSRLQSLLDSISPRADHTPPR